MTIEVNPVGVTCNLSCPYCYEHPMRDAGNFGHKEYDVDKMITALQAEGDQFTLFGGEPLLTHIEDLESIWKYGYDRFGFNNIQTNGCLITDAHIELFKKYNVNVGISVDGPDEMNDTRWAGSLEKTRLMTKKSMDAIDKLSEIGRSPSVILTIHRKNGLSKHRKKLKSWIKELEKKGVKSVRLHALEVENADIANSLALSANESLDFMLDMWEFEETQLENIKFDIFSDIFKMQSGQDAYATCTFQSCDPYTTHAVQGIDGQGNQTNCGRTAKEGIDWLKSDQDGHERNVALYYTPQEYGGCQGCEFWALCKGYCPGTAIDGDWRNRTLECDSLKRMFRIVEALMERHGEVPFSKREDRKEVEEMMLQAMMSGTHISIQNVDWVRSGAQTLEKYIKLRKFRYKHRKYLNKNLESLTKSQLEHLNRLAMQEGIDIVEVVPDFNTRIDHAEITA